MGVGFCGGRVPFIINTEELVEILRESSYEFEGGKSFRTIKFPSLKSIYESLFSEGRGFDALDRAFNLECWDQALVLGFSACVTLDK